MTTYRPQFAFPTPYGFKDQESEQFFDVGSNPALSPSPGDPSTIFNVPLTLDPDGEFLWRGVKFPHTRLLNIGVRFRDPYGNYLSDTFVPIWLAYFSPSTLITNGGQPCIFEPQVVCPPNSVIFADFVSYDVVSWLTGGPSSLALCGIKRYALGGCDCG